MTRKWPILIAIALFGSGFTADTSAENCELTRPRRLPLWSMSGAWRGDTLLLADSFGNAVLNYSKERGFLREEKSPFADMMSLRPRAIKPYGNGWAMQFENHFVALDSTMRPVLNADVFKDGEEVGTRLATTYSWTTGESHIYSCSDFQERGVWQRGLVRFALERPWEFTTLQKFSGEHPMMLHCRLGYPLVAAIESTGYFLIMEDRPLIAAYAVGEPERVLANVDLGTRPEIPDYTSSEQYAITMREVEAAKLPVGLFGWGRYLYLLTREPSSESGTTWRLLKIDPVGTGAVLAEVVLPSRSPHLTVIPGAHHWALVEKGRIRRIGDQDVLGIRYVPAAAIDALPLGAVCGAESIRH